MNRIRPYSLGMSFGALAYIMGSARLAGRCPVALEFCLSLAHGNPAYGVVAFDFATAAGLVLLTAFSLIWWG